MDGYTVRPAYSHGLYRSGTNYLQMILDKAFNQVMFDTNKYGEVPYKHASCVEGLQWHHKDLQICMIWKTPEKWIDSLHRQSFELITEQNWTIEKGDEIIWLPYDDQAEPLLIRDDIPFSIQSLCRYYSKHCSFWKQMIGRWNHSIIAHADVVKDRDAAIAKIASDLGYDTYNVGFDEPKKVRNSRPFTSEVREQYKDPNHFEFLTGPQVDLIRKHTKETWQH